MLRLGVPQAYSTLGTQWVMRGRRPNPVLTAPAVLAVAAAVNRTAAQVPLGPLARPEETTCTECSHRCYRNPEP